MKVIFPKANSLTVIVAILMVSFLTVPTLATTYVVSKDDGDYQSIQEAIDVAKNGDIVLVKEGIYTECLVIDKDLTLKGAGKEKVKIKAAEKGYPVVLIGPPIGKVRTGPKNIEVNLEGIQFTGARARGYQCADKEHNLCPNGMVVRFNTNVELTDSIISDNDWIGIMLVDSSEVMVKDSVISRNTADGIRLEDTSQITINNSTISENGVGIEPVDSSQVNIKDSMVVRQRAHGFEIGNPNQVTIINTNISWNDRGGVVILGGYPEGPRITIADSTILGNGSVGILLASWCRVMLKNNRIQKNNSGITMSFPEQFEGYLKGSGNIIANNHNDFVKVPESIQKYLTKGKI